MGRVDQWTEGLGTAVKDFTEGIIKGLDTPAQATEALMYDEETERDQPYSIGGQLDQDRGYMAEEEEWIYETGRVIGAASPIVAFVGTASLGAFALYAPTTAASAGKAAKEKYYDE